MSAFQLAGKQVIITGASRGIGAEIVRATAELGAKSIVLGYQSNVDAANKLVKELQSDASTKSTQYFPVQGDLKDQKGCEAFIKQATSKLEGGKIDGLVLSAGILKMVDLAHSTDENLDSTMDTNVKGSLFTIQAALPHINNDGRIVCFSSSVLTTPAVLQPPYLQYAMSKASVEMMVKTLARDPSIGGPDRRIGINCINPGATATDMFMEGKSEELVKRIASNNPEQRLGQPKELADATVFFLTPASRWIRGQVLRVNGGQTTV